LTGLPVHLLVTEKPAVALPDVTNLDAYRAARWLMKRQAVSVLPAVASLKALRSSRGAVSSAKPLTGFGNPAFQSGPAPQANPSRSFVAMTRSYSNFWEGADVNRDALSRELAALPGTAAELNAVARDVGASPADVHLGANASESMVKALPLADFRIVYFATHALVAGDIKGLGEPALALTLPKTPNADDDGLLTASEVAALKLDADWVVLSACNTAAGDKPGAEALSGLARSFFYAGARALLVSHWDVGSDAATRLMTSTFDIMKSDPQVGKSEALRRAMLAYLNDKSDPWSAHPAFWGPFSLVGDGKR
jgi:CHAT domain-containing protein